MPVQEVVVVGPHVDFARWYRILRLDRLSLSHAQMERKYGIGTSTSNCWQTGETYSAPLQARILAHLGRDYGMPPLPEPFQTDDGEDGLRPSEAPR